MTTLSFGDKLKKIRTDRKLSQEELGELLGTTKQVISRYETNQRTPKITVVKEYAEKLNVPLEYLINNEISDPTEISEPNVQALPRLTPKDEREIAKDLEAMLNSLDNKNGMAAYNNPEDEEDRELLRASLEYSMRLAKQMAKKKFTPKKYRKE